MLDPADTILLAAGVRVEHRCVVDDVRDDRLPLNEAATFVLERAGRPLGDIAGELAAAYDIDLDRARHDVLAFAFRLNRLLLVNVVRGHRRPQLFGRALRSWLPLVLSGGLPRSPWRRLALDSRSGPRAAITALRAVSARAAAMALAASLLAAQTAALAGAAPPSSSLAVGLAVGSGLAAHEAGHAAALGGVPAAIVLAGPRTFVVHRAVTGARRRLIAISGPVAPLLLAVLVVLAARPLGSTVLALAGCALGGHAVGLTVATGDGRAACGF